MILLMLPGTAVTYSGEELGMENAPVIWGVVRERASPEYSHKKNSGKRHWLRVRLEKVSELVSE
jgi:glycosidase